jgi:hypothetical protein
MLFSHSAGATYPQLHFIPLKIGVFPEAPGYIYFDNLGHNKNILQEQSNDFGQNGYLISFNPYISHDFEYHFASNAFIAGRYNNFEFYVQPQILLSQDASGGLGIDYSRSNLSGRFESGMLVYTDDFGKISVGRSKIWWGESWDYSIIHARTAHPYNHLMLSIISKNMTYEFLVGQLSTAEYSSQISPISRYISGQRLVLSIPNKRLKLSVGEFVVYGGSDRSIDFNYISPFIPFGFTSIDQEEGGLSKRDDNYLIFFDGRYSFENNQLFWEILIDDFQIDAIDRKDYPDAVGFKVGLSGKIYFGKNPGRYNVEYTQINKWTYTHEDNLNNFQNRGDALGFMYGPDSEVFTIQYEHGFLAQGIFLLHADFISQGSIDIMDIATQRGSKNDFRHFGSMKKYSRCSLLYENTIDDNWYYRVGVLGDTENRKHTVFTVGVQHSFTLAMEIK